MSTRGSNGWRAWLDNTDQFSRRQISVFVGQEHMDGSLTYYVDMGCSLTDERARDQVLYHATSQDRNGPDMQRPLPLQLEEEAWRAIMEELQRHFGVYVGVDYDRLRADYDRMVTDLRTAREELKEVNEFIREQLDIATMPRDRASAPVARNRPRGRKADAEAGGPDQ